MSFDYQSTLLQQFPIQEHSLHIGDHEMLPIEDEAAPERYEVERCLVHKRQILDEICKHCMKQFCWRCQTKDRCPALKKDSDPSPGISEEGIIQYICSLMLSLEWPNSA